ncbi:hypothetical protein N9F61_00080 [Akkermansiaceae bacterium]|nr:hypothetical protein [Akkermansiaceae bacterium]MDB4356544.1 hypothetical protein [Akkermansiaceae bacterium]MDB4373765.1 hypothetical protein [Akkermansiaceae bacterium]
MNSLEKRCDSLNEKFTRLDSVIKNTAQTNQLEVIERKVTVLAEKSEKALRHFSTLENAGLCNDIQWNPAIKLRELSDRLDKTIQKVRESPEKVKDDQTWAKCERLAHDASRELSSKLKSLWRKFVDDKTQNRVGTLSAFRGLAQCRDAIVSLETKQQQAAGRREQLPESQEDIEFIVSLDESMTELINGIGIKDEPEEMINFLKRCASGSGVPLNELTDERLDWLRSKEYGKNLKIRG